MSPGIYLVPKADLDLQECRERVESRERAKDENEPSRWPKMSANIARGHGGDGGGDDRKGTPKPNLGGRRAGRLYTRQKTWNLELKAITDKSGPVPIRFEFGDRETLMPLGDHAARWANYLGELVREFPLHYPSWRQMPPERKAAVMVKIRMKSSATREYLSLIHTFFLTHTVGGVFLNPVDKALYLESKPEYGGGNESGGCGDDEPGDDEDGGQDGEEEDDS
nr:hypothetical protein [Tanacetum cinerariifolium]